MRRRNAGDARQRGAGNGLPAFPQRARVDFNQAPARRNLARAQQSGRRHHHEVIRRAPTRQLRELGVDAHLRVDRLELAHDIAVRGDLALAKLPGREFLEQARAFDLEVRLAPLHPQLFDHAAPLEQVRLALGELGGIGVVGGKVGTRLLAFNRDHARRARPILGARAFPRAFWRAERGNGARIVGVIEPTQRVIAVAVERAGDLERHGATSNRAQPSEGNVLELKMALGFGHGVGADLHEKDARAGVPCARVGMSVVEIGKLGEPGRDCR